MAVRSSGGNLSFEILNGNGFFDEDDFRSHHYHKRYNTDSTVSFENSNHDNNSNRKKKNKKKRKKPKLLETSSIITEEPIVDSTLAQSNCSNNFGNGAFISELRTSYVGSVGGETLVRQVSEETEVVDSRNRYSNNFGELRQRNVSGGEEEEAVTSSKVVEKETEGGEVEASSTEDREWRGEGNGSVVPVPKLETAESLDWKSVMAKYPNNLLPIDRLLLKYLVDEMYKGNSLRSTTTLGSEKERERVYDTIFRLPWRCELLIDVGFFVCFDSFLSLLTVMPTRIIITLLRFLRTRQFEKPSSAELSDLACLIVLGSGVVILEQMDISLIYHMIRGQGTIKLYVVYNVLEIFDRLFQSFCGDVLETLFNSAEGLASSSPENVRFWFKRFISDQALAMAASIFHSFILLAQAITLSTCIVAHNNALLALLVSNNFAEIKSNVFKRFSRDNIHSLVYADSVERFHILAFLLFVLAQNIREAEGPWFESFLSNALLVFLCEMLIDIIKHSFLAKFNDLKPLAYSEFLEELCNQTLNIQTGNKKRNLTFVPLAPACVVIRVLTPVYAAHLPCNPLPWRWFWILLLFAMTYVMLTSLKVMIGMGLERFATWYINRCRYRRQRLHAD